MRKSFHILDKVFFVVYIAHRNSDFESAVTNLGYVEKSDE